MLIIILEYDKQKLGVNINETATQSKTLTFEDEHLVITNKAMSILHVKLLNKAYSYNRRN